MEKTIVYELLWRNKWLTAEATTIGEMIEALRGAADELEEMKRAGVSLVDNGCTADDYALLVTDDREVAKKYGFEKAEAA